MIKPLYIREFVSFVGCGNYVINRLQQSNTSEVYLLETPREKYIYKVRSKPLTSKSINERKALGFLTELYPREKFFPRYVWCRENESALTYLEGITCLPFSLSAKSLKHLTTIINKLLKDTTSSTFTLDIMDQPVEGSSFDIVYSMWSKYIQPKIDGLSTHKKNFARKLKSKMMRELNRHQPILTKNISFKFMHYDLVNNLVVDREQVGLIDWEISGFSDPAYNLAVLETVGKLTHEQSIAFRKNLDCFLNKNFQKRYLFFRKLAFMTNYLWLYEKLKVDKILPVTSWTLESLEDALLKELE